MSYRQRPGETPPGHGPGDFDDPFMMPAPSPRGDGPSQRRAALVWLAVIVVVVVIVLVVLLTR